MGLWWKHLDQNQSLWVKKNEDYIIQDTGHSIDLNTMVIATEVNAPEKRNREQGK